MDSIWHEITRLGEAGFLLPVAAMLSIWFLLRHCERLALLWSALFGLGVLIVLVSKIAFLGWGVGIRSWNFTGFSGHSMLASSVFPVLARYASIGIRPKWWRVTLLAAIGLAGVVAFSRVLLQAHSVSEAIAGFTLGLTVALSFIIRGIAKLEARIPIWLVVVALALSSVSHIEHYAPSRGIIVALALRVSGHQHTYRREHWLAHPNDKQA